MIPDVITDSKTASNASGWADYPYYIKFEGNFPSNKNVQLSVIRSVSGTGVIVGNMIMNRNGYSFVVYSALNQTVNIAIDYLYTE